MDERIPIQNLPSRLSLDVRVFNASPIAIKKGIGAASLMTQSSTCIKSCFDFNLAQDSVRFFSCFPGTLFTMEIQDESTQSMCKLFHFPVREFTKWPSKAFR